MGDYEFTIKSHEFWNDINFALVGGTTYHMISYGTWYDAGIPAHGDGYPTNNLLLVATQFLRRAPGQRLFTLMGTLDQDMSTLFKIGVSSIYTAPRSGRLCCFANDVPGFYFNNTGYLTLTVQ